MLVVTTSVGMGRGHHGNSGHDGPHLLLGLAHVEHSSGLEDGLLGSSASSDDSDGGSRIRVDGLANSGGKSDSGAGSVLRLRDHGRESAGGTGVLTLVASVLLDVADEGTFGDFLHRKNVSDSQRSLGSAVNILAGVESLGSDIELGVGSEGVGVSELNLGDRGSSARIVDDLPDDPANEAVSFSVVQAAEPNLALSVEGTRLE